MARDKPRLLAALEVASAALAKEEEAGKEQDALDLYQHSLGELLVLLAGKAPALVRALPLVTLSSPSPLSLQQRPQAEGGSSFTPRFRTSWLELNT